MIEIVVYNDDIIDWKNMIDILQNFLTHDNIDYNLQPFTSAMEMLEKVKKLDIAILGIAMGEKRNRFG